MSFTPENDRPPSGDFEYTRDLPVPRGGSRKARIALIVDLGTQEREDFEDPNTGEFKPQKPCQQVAVFADLVADTVDYGGKIGKQHYRMLLNKSFMGKVVGINFAKTPPKDAKGNTVQGKPWGLHPANVLSKIAKAIGRPEVIESADISQLLDEPFMAQVEVKETPDKNGKKDKDTGELIVYKNVNFKGAAPVPEDDDGEPLPVAELNQRARCITFKNATVEDVQFIRASLIRQIKLANNYAGSQMQRAIEQFEAENAGSGDAGDEQEETPKPKVAEKKPQAPKKKPASAPQEDVDESEIPF